MKRTSLPAAYKSIFVSGLATFIYLSALHPFSVFESPKLKTQDLFFKARARLAARPAELKDIVLITVDDASIVELDEKLPFSRKLYAKMLDNVSKQDPQVIGFDFVFKGKGDPMGDFVLGLAIRKAENVVLASRIDSEGNHNLSHPGIQSAAKASGVVNKELDSDLSVRRVKLAYQNEAGVVLAWPWEVELLSAYLNIEPESRVIADDGIRRKGLDEGAPLIPKFDGNTTTINYRFRLEDVAQVPFWEAVRGDDLTSRFKDKIVLVGATSRALHDFHLTPLGYLPGVIVNLNFLVNTISRDYLRRIPSLLDGMAVAVFVLLSCYFGLRFDAVRGLVRVIGATGLFLAFYLVLFFFNLSGDSFSAIALGWLIFLSIVFYRSFATVLENLQLKSKVITDPLTGLFNRRALEARIDSELEKVSVQQGGRRTDAQYELSLLMMDVDNFKKVNDTYGHQFGDDVLKNLSFSITENIRADDLAARYGGEEFCVVLPHTSKEQAGAIAEKIRLAVEETKLSYVNTIAKFTVSIGVAAAKEDKLLAIRSILRGADQALYDAKTTGKNKVALYKEKK
jgi:diguanylate cyclase (GGDEF)-like protein